MKTNKINAVVKVQATKYKSTSFYGNPSYWVIFEHNGERIKAYTATDAACGYGCTNYEGKMCEISYHYTRTGNAIIDYMRTPEK